MEVKRYTKRDDCGNAHLELEANDENAVRAFRNHIALLEDWYDVFLKDGLAKNQVIRCKDCMFYVDGECKQISYAIGHIYYVSDNDYCGLAERRIDA